MKIAHTAQSTVKGPETKNVKQFKKKKTRGKFNVNKLNNEKHSNTR